MTISPAEDRIEIVVNLSRAGQFRSGYLTNPSRFYVDFANTQLEKPRMAVAAPGSSLVLDVRVANHTPRVSRLVVDLGAIRENIARFRALCGPQVAILAVLKAWAFGRGEPAPVFLYE